MDDGTPALEVGFAFDIDGVVEAVAQAEALTNTMEAKMLVGVTNVERAFKGMVDLGPATASISSFGNAASRDLQSASRELAKVEKAGESLSRRLDQQAATFGKTSSEIRAMKVETAALAAEQKGLTELAERLRSKEADLYAQEFAAARQAGLEAQAAAAEKVAAAERSASAMAAEAASAREAAQGHLLFEAAAKRGAAAMREADAAAASFEQMVGRVNARIDPSAVAIGKLATELDEAKRAFDASRISAEQFEQEQARITGAAGNLYGPQRRLAGAIEDVGTAQRFTAAETLNLSRQFQDIGVTAAMGMNPLMILAQQGPQIYDVLEQAKNRGVGAAAALKQMGMDAVSYGATGLAKLATFITPVNALLAGTAVATVLVVKSLGTYDAAMQRFETTAAGLGRVSGETAGQLEAISEAAAASGERSIGATRDSVAAFAAAGIQGEQTLTSLAANVERYAKLTGQDVPTAQAALAAAMKDPAHAADTFTQQLGLLTGAQYEHIKQLAAQGDQDQATAELTRILTRDLAANTAQTTGLSHYMDVLGSAVSGVATMFGKLDGRIRSAGASYDAWLKQHAGGWAVDLFGTGNQVAPPPDPKAARNQDQIAALNASQSMNTTGMKQYNDLLAQQRILQKGLADTTGLNAVQVQGLRHDYAAVTDTINANRSASGAWITTQERAHLIAQAQDKLAAAHTQRDKAVAQQQITRLQLGTQVLTQQERQTQAMDAYNKVADKYVKPKTDHHADELARDAEAIEAQIGNLYKLADAYKVSDAASLLAEARVKAESKAIKDRGDVETAVAREVRLVVAQRVSDAARSTAATIAQTAAEKQINDQVAAGALPVSRAADALRDMIALRPLEAALAAAQQVKDTKGAEAARAAIAGMTAAQKEANAEKARGSLIADVASSADALERIRLEASLIGATNAQRAIALAQLEAEQHVRSLGQSGTDEGRKYIDARVAEARATGGLQVATDNYNASLTRQSELLDVINEQAQAAGQGLSDAFGKAGDAIGAALSALTNYGAVQAHLAEEKAAQVKAAGGNAQRLADIEKLYAIRSATAQVAAIGSIITAAKGLFKEHSEGYKIMEGAEKAYRVVQLALAIKTAAEQIGLMLGLTATKVATDTTMAASDTVRAGVEQSNSVATTAVKAVEAVVNAIKSLPFPLNLAAGAATVAALATLGISIAGGFGSGKNTLAKANDGTGTVLGDSTAKSDSIQRSIDSLKNVDTITMTYSRDMLTSLRSIDSHIGGLASLLVQTGNLDASAAGVTEGFKTSTVGKLASHLVDPTGLLSKIPVLGDIVGAISGVIKSLFGTKTKVVGQGLFAGDQSLASILSGGFDASTYSDIQKKKKFFGLTTSTKYKTQYGDLDDSIQQQFGLILKSFDDAVTAAAGPLGLATSDIAKKLDGFVVSIGKIDLKGLTGDEIQQKLEAVFGALGDDMAKAAIPGLEKFAQVGEGYLETLTRVASTVETVTDTLIKLGDATSSLGVDASMGIAAQFDSLSDFSSAADSYFQSYYSQAEQAAARSAQLANVFASLNMTMPDTLAGFRALVEAQDLTTTAGQSTYATLLQLAPAFADLKTSLEGAKSAADIASERQDLQRQIFEAQGDTAAIRALDLAKLDASNRNLQEQLYAIQDAKDAAAAASQLADAWSSVGESIKTEIDRIRGLTDTSAGGSFATLLGHFNAANTAARGGDQDAAKSLPALSQSLLTAAAAAATSRQELDRVQVQTAAQLEATYVAISGLTGTSSTLSDTTVSTVTATQASSAATNANDNLADEIASLRAEVAQLRSDNNAGHAATAANTGSMKRTLDNVTNASGGDAIATVAA